jgi:deazaflavin-dependent oxidoreductase (nitroreductase family)
MTRMETLGVFRSSSEDVLYAETLVPREVHVQSLGLHDEPDMFAELAVRAGVAECVSLVWRAKETGRAVRTSDIQELPSLEIFAADAFLRYSRVIAEFRAEGGKVGGQFEGAPLILLHHVDRNSGQRYVAPVFYMQAEDSPAVIYVFATKGGALENPNWYYNLLEAGVATIELGTETHTVNVQEMLGEVRDRIYAEQARRYPGFAEYERLNAGTRVIPVLALTRSLETIGVSER